MRSWAAYQALWVALLFTIHTRSSATEEAFVEEAIVSPLHDGLVLVHFHFTLTAPYRHHYTLFPKAVGQLVSGIPFDDLELSLTQGRWHYSRWGLPPLGAKPAGAELVASFSPLLPEGRVPGLWSNLSHALGGLLCASLNFVARPEATAQRTITMQQHPACAAPNLTTDSTGSSNSSSCGSSGWFPAAAVRCTLYAALPQEASCTENLTPWLKLLPCRDVAGLGQLLTQRDVVFGADFHSMQVSLKVQRDPHLKPLHSTLTQTLTLVLRPPAASSKRSSTAHSSGGAKLMPPRPGALADVGLAALMGSQLEVACPLAQHSRVYLRLPGKVATTEEQQQQLLQIPAYEDAATAEAADAEQRENGEADTSTNSTDSAADSRSSAADSDGGQDIDTALGSGSRGVNGGGQAVSSSRASSWQHPAFTLSPAPDAVAVMQWATDSVVYIYDQSIAAEATTAGSVVPFRLNWSFSRSGQAGTVSGPTSRPSQPLFSVTRYITGSGNLHGGIVLQLRKEHGAAAAAAWEGAAAAGHGGAGGSVSVCIFQVVPWYIRLWLHTLQLSIDGQLSSLDRHLHLRHISTSRDRARPQVLDLCLDLPASAQHITLAAHFTKAFLTAFEHPPDAHRGFDVPAAHITLGGTAAGRGAAGGVGGRGCSSIRIDGSRWCVAVAQGAAAEVLQAETALMEALAQPRPQQVTSPGLVVPLAVPDFSMPYNVICLTSTVLAVFLGATLNTLLLRPGKTEREAAAGAEADRAARRRKTLKVLLVIVVFGGLGVYLDPSLQEGLVEQVQALGWRGVPAAGATAPG